MFSWIAECSFDNPAGVFVPIVRLYFVASPKKITTNEFFQQRILFPRMFPGPLEYRFDNPVWQTADLTTEPKFCGAKFE